MENSKANSRKVPDKATTGSDTATQKSMPTSHFKKKLVPLDEYAARQGISSDIIEQQGRLGVVQVRKYKGRKFVVDVPAEQLSSLESGEDEEATAMPVRRHSLTRSKLVTAGLIAGLVIIIVSIFWLYMDAKQKLDDLNAEFASIQSRYNDLITVNQNVKALQDELAGSKAELARIQNRIAVSKAEMERIQADLNKARRNLETIQSELAGIQGQLSLSKVEIEGIQNGLNESRRDLDTLHQQNLSAETQK
jgi:septal ring factor EnvC (AmiA/AmiB activator)